MTPDERLDWHTTFMSMAYLIGRRSQDPSTKVGCVITTAQNELVSVGYNGLPRNIDYLGEIQSDGLPERLSSVDAKKYQWFIHAESNAILNAGRIGRSLLGCRLYITWRPCHDVNGSCTNMIIQSGISEVFVHAPGQNAFQATRSQDKHSWHSEGNPGAERFREAGVAYHEIDCEIPNDLSTVWFSGGMVDVNEYRNVKG